MLCSVLIVAQLLLVACNPAPAPADDLVPESIVLQDVPGGSCGVELPADAEDDMSADEARIRALIAAEGQLVVAREIGPLMALWTEDSRVVNAKNTPEDPDDDQVWRGTDAIRHRYLNVVFPSAPETVSNVTLQISIDGDTAQARGTTQIGGELSPNGDLWQLTRAGECWYLQQLTYNLEPLPAQ